MKHIFIIGLLIAGILIAGCTQPTADHSNTQQGNNGYMWQSQDDLSRIQKVYFEDDNVTCYVLSGYTSGTGISCFEGKK